MNNYTFDNIHFQSHAPFASDNTCVSISQFKFFCPFRRKKLFLFTRKKLTSDLVNSFNQSTENFAGISVLFMTM